MNVVAPESTPASSVEANGAGATGGARAALPFARTSSRSVSSPVSPFRLMRAVSSLTRPLALRSITHQPRPAYGCMLVCAPAGSSVSTRSTCVLGCAYQVLIAYGRGGGRAGAGGSGAAGGGQRAVWAARGSGARRTFNAFPKVAFSSGVRSSSALPRERCGIET